MMSLLDARRLSNAIQLAALKHHGVERQLTGEPYIIHPLRILMKVQDRPGYVQIAAVLHDLVEDTDVTLTDLIMNFGAETAHLVDILSRREGETYGQFILRIVSNNPDAVDLKALDIGDNLKGLPEGHPLRERYIKALMVLQSGPDHHPERAEQPG